MIEKIDQAPDKTDSYQELVQSIADFVLLPSPSIKERLAIERKVRKYQDSNASDWLLNIMLSVHKECQTRKEKH